MFHQLKKAIYNNLLPEDLFRTDISIERAKELFRLYVDSLEIETHSYCNRTCWFCPNSFIDRRSNNITLSTQILDKICGDLSSIDYNGKITFSGYNEPLYDGIIFIWSKLLKEACPKSIIIAFTNGDYLNSDTLQGCIQNSIDRLHVDLYPAEGKEAEQSEHARILKLFKNRTQIELVPTKHGYFEIQVNGIHVIARIATYDSSTLSTRGGLLNIPKTNTYIRTAPCLYPINMLTIHYSGEGMLCCQVRPDHANHRQAVIVDLNRLEENLFTYYRKLGAARKALIGTGPKSGVCRSCDFADEIETWAARHRLATPLLSSIPGLKHSLEAFIRYRRINRKGVTF
jgi:hypothetical protein